MFRLPFGGHGKPWIRLKIGPLQEILQWDQEELFDRNKQSEKISWAVPINGLIRKLAVVLFMNNDLKLIPRWEKTSTGDIKSQTKFSLWAHSPYLEERD